MNSINMPFVTLGSLALAAGISCLVIGCSAHGGRPMTANVFIDGSDRTQTQLQKELGLLFDCNRNLRSSDRLNIFVFGHGCEPIYRGRKLSSRRALNAVVLPKLFGHEDRLWRAGTTYDASLSEAARQRGTDPTVTIVIGDGGFEDHSSSATSSIERSIRTLAHSDADSRFLMVGVAPEYRTAWERVLGPLGPSWFAVRGFADAEDQIAGTMAATRGGSK